MDLCSSEYTISAEKCFVWKTINFFICVDSTAHYLRVSIFRLVEDFGLFVFSYCLFFNLQVLRINGASVIVPTQGKTRNVIVKTFLDKSFTITLTPPHYQQQIYMIYGSFVEA